MRPSYTLVNTIVFLGIAAQALCQDVKITRWSESQNGANSYLYNGVKYYSMSNQNVSVSVSVPNSGKRFTLYNVVFENKIVPRFDIEPSQFDCFCVGSNGKFKKLRQESPNLILRNGGKPFLGNSLGAGSRHAGTIALKGSCKRYMVRWTVSEGTSSWAVEFYFD
jgi:hypothetical protein